MSIVEGSMDKQTNSVTGSGTAPSELYAKQTAAFNRYAALKDRPSTDKERDAAWKEYEAACREFRGEGNAPSVNDGTHKLWCKAHESQNVRDCDCYDQTGEGAAPRVYCHQVNYGDGDTLSVSAVKSKPRETICILLGFKRDLAQVTAQRDELLAWKKDAVATSERQLVAFQEMQSVAQRKESEKRELLAENKRLQKALDAAMRSRDRIIDEWTPPDRRAEIAAAIAKVEGK